MKYIVNGKHQYIPDGKIPRIKKQYIRIKMTDGSHNADVFNSFFIRHTRHAASLQIHPGARRSRKFIRVHDVPASSSGCTTFPQVHPGARRSRSSGCTSFPQVHLAYAARRVRTNRMISHIPEGCDDLPYPRRLRRFAVSPKVTVICRVPTNSTPP